jgi:hypothetical protein
LYYTLSKKKRDSERAVYLWCARRWDGDPPPLEQEMASHENAGGKGPNAKSKELRSRKNARLARKAAVESEGAGENAGTASDAAAEMAPGAAEETASSAATGAGVQEDADVYAQSDQGTSEGAGALPWPQLVQDGACSACQEAATRAWAAREPRDPARSRKGEGLPPAALVFHPVFGVVPWEYIDAAQAAEVPSVSIGAPETSDDDVR